MYEVILVAAGFVAGYAFRGMIGKELKSLSADVKSVILDMKSESAKLVGDAKAEVAKMVADAKAELKKV